MFHLQKQLQLSRRPCSELVPRLPLIDEIKISGIPIILGSSEFLNFKLDFSTNIIIFCEDLLIADSSGQLQHLSIAYLSIVI